VAIVIALFKGGPALRLFKFSPRPNASPELVGGRGRFASLSKRTATRASSR
jgi:hypothetical protein